MIYELRTYNLPPRQVPEYEKLFAERLSDRLAFSQLAGFWHTEIGPLNQVVHIWPYEDLNQRSEVRQQAAASGKWPPDTSHLTLSMQSEILVPVPFMTPMGERDIGPLYEMRTYTYPAGTIPKVVDAWSKSIAEREKLSPLAGCWVSEIGGLNKFVHLWAYKSFEERMRVRAEAAEKGIWPPKSGVIPIIQENKLLFPASYSPMK